MMSILRKTTASMAGKGSRSTPVDFVCDDLSTWEIVSDCLSDDDVYSFDGDVSISDGDVSISDGDGSIGDEVKSKTAEEDGGTCVSRVLRPSDDATSAISGGDDITSDAPELKMEEEGVCVSHDSGIPVGVISPSVTVPRHPYDHGYDDSPRCVDDVHYGEEEEVEDDALFDDDVDDELVPWKFKDRFGKQRIKKTGKRGGPKVNKSKRLPYYYNRPGCLYGKHGLGVQHAYL